MKKKANSLSNLDVLLEAYRRGFLVFEDEPVGGTPDSQGVALIRAIRDGRLVLKPPILTLIDSPRRDPSHREKEI